MSTTTNVDGVITSRGNLQFIDLLDDGIRVFRLIDSIPVPEQSVVRIMTGFNNPPPGRSFLVNTTHLSHIGFEYLNHVGFPYAPTALMFRGQEIIRQPANV